jgi:hypothetical protein
MELTVGRGGGLSAYAEELGPVDSASLNDELREGLEESMGFFELPQSFPVSGAQSDAMWYSLKIATTDETRAVTWDDNHEGPSQLKEIVNLLESSGAGWHPPLDAHDRSQ